MIGEEGSKPANEDASPSTPGPGPYAVPWPGDLPVRPTIYGFLAVLAVAGQIAAFLYGFWEVADSRPRPMNARTLAGLGLLGTLLVLVLTVNVVRRGWVPVEGVLLFLGVGLIAGAFVATELPEMLEGGGFLENELFLYKAFILGYGAVATAILLATAVFAYLRNKSWWTSLLAGPVLLGTGAHASLLVGLMRRADEVAAAARAIVLAV